MDNYNSPADMSVNSPELTQPAGGSESTVINGASGIGTENSTDTTGTSSRNTVLSGSTSDNIDEAFESLFDDDGDEEDDGGYDDDSEGDISAETDGDSPDEEDEPDEASSGKGAKKGASKQSPEVDAAFAQLRRRYEAQLAAQKAQTEDTVYASLNLKNPYTGETIKNKAQYQAYEAAHAQAVRAEAAKKTGLSLEMLDRIIADSPAVKQASEAARRMEDEKKNAQRAAVVERLKNEVAEIGRYEESVKTLEDVAKLNCYPKIFELTKKGVSLIDAYKLANIDTIAEKRAAAAKQKALNDAAGKGHLRKESGSRGKGAASVPASVMALYRDLNPDATDEEIVKHYRKYHSD